MSVSDVTITCLTSCNHLSAFVLIGEVFTFVCVPLLLYEGGRVTGLKQSQLAERAGKA